MDHGTIGEELRECLQFIGLSADYAKFYGRYRWMRDAGPWSAS